MTHRSNEVLVDSCAHRKATRAEVDDRSGVLAGICLLIPALIPELRPRPLFLCVTAASLGGHIFLAVVDHWRPPVARAVALVLMLGSAVLSWAGSRNDRKYGCRK